MVNRSILIASFLVLHLSGFCSLSGEKAVTFDRPTSNEAIGVVSASHSLTLSGQVSFDPQSLEESEAMVTVHSGVKLKTSRGITVVEFFRGGKVGFCRATSTRILNARNQLLLAVVYGFVSFDLPGSKTDEILSADWTVRLLPTQLSQSGSRRGFVSISNDGSICVSSDSSVLTIEHRWSGRTSTVRPGEAIKLLANGDQISATHCLCFPEFDASRIVSSEISLMQSNETGSKLKESDIAVDANAHYNDILNLAAVQNQQNGEGSVNRKDQALAIKETPESTNKNTKLPPIFTGKQSINVEPSRPPKRSFGQKIKSFFKLIFLWRR